MRQSGYLPSYERVEELLRYAVFRLMELRAYRIDDREEVVDFIVVADEFQDGNALGSEFPDLCLCRKRTRDIFISVVTINQIPIVIHGYLSPGILFQHGHKNTISFPLPFTSI